MTPKNTLKDLIEYREKLFNLLQVRKTLGAFDANSEAIVLMCEANLSAINYLISQAESPDSKKK